MNISRLKELLQPLPDSFPASDLADSLADELRAELDDCLETMNADLKASAERELQIAEERVAQLRKRLGKDSPPPVRPPMPAQSATHVIGAPFERGETDFDNGIGSDDEESDRQSFTQELAQLRARGVAKRRSRLEH